MRLAFACVEVDDASEGANVASDGACVISLGRCWRRDRTAAWATRDICHLTGVAQENHDACFRRGVDRGCVVGCVERDRRPSRPPSCTRQRWMFMRSRARRAEDRNAVARHCGTGHRAERLVVRVDAVDRHARLRARRRCSGGLRASGRGRRDVADPDGGKPRKGRVTETAGVRGIDESELKAASLNQAQLTAMIANRVDETSAAAFAAQHGWSATAVAYSGRRSLRRRVRRQVFAAVGSGNRQRRPRRGRIRR